MPAKDVSLTAYFIKTWTVQFNDYNGAILKTEVVDEGASATAPTNPTRAGYTFIGWDIVYSNVTSNLIVTAKYARNTFSIVATTTYESAQCDGSMTTVEDATTITMDRSSSSHTSMVNEGDSKTYTIIPVEGTDVIVYIDGEPIGGGITSYTFSNVDDTHRICAYFKPIVSLSSIIFNPDGAQIESSLSTTITGIGIQEGSLQYIVSNSSTVADNTITNYTNNDIYTFSGDWTTASLVLGSDVTPVNVYRSASGMSINSDSMALIENVSQDSNIINFEYLLDAASTSYLGITINGQEIELNGSNDWQTFSNTVQPEDGKIIIGLTYSKGESVSGNDLAAIKNLKVGSGWTSIASGQTINFGALGLDTYIHAKALSTAGQEITAISKSFNISSSRYPECSILATSNIGGTITPLGISKVYRNSDKSYIITPDVGYYISDLRIDGINVGVGNAYTSNTYTFSGVTADHTIEAIFAQ
jgi:hypothetical protein